MTKIGLIGAGAWSTPYAESANAVGVEISGIYAPDSSAAELAERTGASAATNPREVMESCDYVLIGSPTDTHAEYLAMAAETGKPALCASPTIADLNKLQNLQTSTSGAKAYSSFPLRARPEYSRLKTAVASGDLGTIGIYRFGICRPRPTGWRAETSRSGGLLLETGVHLLDWLEWVGGPIVRIYGATSSTETSPYTVLVAKMAEGSIAHLELSWTESEGVSYDYYEVAGSNGLLEYDSRTAPLMLLQSHENTSSEALSPGASAAEHELRAFVKKLEGGEGGFTTLEHGLDVCQKAIRVKAAIEAGEVFTF